jgi:hypothetical protein
VKHDDIGVFMYSVQSEDRLHPAVLFIIHVILIVFPLGILDLLIGDSLWYLDHFLLMVLISFIQWYFFRLRPALGTWLLCVVSALLIMMIVVGPIVDVVVRVTIRDRFFPFIPNTRMDSRYLFIDRLIVNSVLGSIIGILQWIVLKKENASVSWWIPMTISAYALTTLSWYMYVLR